jgi:PqqD family protein of HPr-rel-A system
VSIIYRAEPPDQIISECLGAIDVLYHRRSGATHLIAAPVPQIIEALAQGPADLDTLMARLSARFELADGDEARQALAARLAELAHLGLVHCG